MEENKVLIHGKKVHYAKTGEGPTIILVHGWSNNWMGWIPLMRELEDTYTIYAIDQMGFGKSDRLEHYSVPVQAHFLAGFISQLSKKPLAVCGMSLGTFVVADFGLKYPDLTENIVLVGAVLPVGRRRRFVNLLVGKSLEVINGREVPKTVLKKIIEQRLTAYIVSKYLNMHKFNKFLIDTYGLIGRKEMTKEAYVEMGISASHYRLDKAINSLSLPTLLLFGSNDRFTTLVQVHEMLDRQDFSYVEIPQSGHITTLEKPRLVAEAIRGFLRERKSQLEFVKKH